MSEDIAKISDSARNLSTPTRAFPVIWIIFLCHCFPSQPQHFTEVFPLRVYLGLSETPMDEDLLFPMKMARPGFNPPGRPQVLPPSGVRSPWKRPERPCCDFSARHPRSMKWWPGPFRWDGWDFVCLKMLCTPKPNGFADHYPY